MSVDINRNKDVWSGVLLMGIGGTAIYIARDYTFGTALRMGPGYFPIVLGSILVLFGLYFFCSGLVRSEKIEGSSSMRALLIVPLSLALFGIFMDPPGWLTSHIPDVLEGHIPTGFVPALFVLILGSAMASTEFRFVEVLLFSILLTALCAGVFIYGLGLPYELVVWV
jgi:hypothetical protein